MLRTLRAPGTRWSSGIRRPLTQQISSRGRIINSLETSRMHFSPARENPSEGRRAAQDPEGFFGKSPRAGACTQHTHAHTTPCNSVCSIQTRTLADVIRHPYPAVHVYIVIQALKKSNGKRKRHACVLSSLRIAGQQQRSVTTCHFAREINFLSPALRRVRDD